MKTRIAISILSLIVVAAAWANWPVDSLPAGTTADRIVVEKGARVLTLYSGANVVRRYRVALGRVPVGPKEREGDKKTPEGVYRILEHKLDSSFHRALRVSYPEQSDVERAKRQGVNPGSDIMVHGLRNGMGFLGRAHRAIDWTAGCIAVTNPEIDQIFQVIADGAQIEIRP